MTTVGDVPPANFHLISYVYQTNGIFYHGTISDLDGIPKSTWTLTRKREKTEVNQPINQDTFAFLWNGIATFPIFKKSLVQGASTPIDFYHFIIISISFRQDGQIRGGNYSISPNEKDPEFDEWLDRLNVPTAPFTSSN